MACRGIYYAVTPQQSLEIFSKSNTNDIISYLDDIGENQEDQNFQYLDKSWDAIHRCLTDGTLYDNAGHYPLNRCVLGGVALYDKEDFIVRFVSAQEVKDISDAFGHIDRGWVYNQYTNLKFPNYQHGEKSEEDFEYTWNYLEQAISFYSRASSLNKAIVF